MVQDFRLETYKRLKRACLSNAISLNFKKQLSKTIKAPGLIGRAQLVAIQPVRRLLGDARPPQNLIS